jgi:neutral trehalase
MKKYLVTYTATYDVMSDSEDNAVDEAIEAHSMHADGTWEAETDHYDTTTTAKGLSPKEYNALIHAIWRLDNLIAEFPKGLCQSLELERETLSNLFQRIS